MTEPNTPQVTPVPGAEAGTEAEKAAAAEAEATAQETATETAEAAKEAEKTATEATTKASEAKKAAEAAAPPRTYSQEEWEKRESAKDQEISGLKTVASQVAMQAQIGQQQQAEAAARAKDQSDMDQGLITQADAQQRQQARMRAFQEQQRAIQEQPKMEQLGRLQAAQDFGGRYGVNPSELLSDKAIQTPQQMEAKAKQLGKAESDATSQVTSDKIANLEAEIKTLKGEDPQYDQGQLGTAGPKVDQMSPEEKIKWGLKHPVKTK